MLGRCFSIGEYRNLYEPAEGSRGFRMSFMPEDVSDLAAFLALHAWHAHTTLSHCVVPPWDLGITWSTVLAGVQLSLIHI